jgi:Ni/Co efflux regulator RcnB
VLAQQDEHHRDGNRGNQEQSARPVPVRPAPAPAPVRAPAPVIAAPVAQGAYRNGPGAWNGQARPAPGNPAVNGWQPHQSPPVYQGQPAYRGQPVYQGQTRGGAWTGQGRNEGGQNRGDWRANDRPGRHVGGPQRGAGDGRAWAGGQWNHGWRQDHRYDWRGWREENRDAFHAGRYYPPYRDYAYNRLGIGFYLQPLFFGSDYWITDPYYYRLPPAYGPYHWVRYYNDAILVNTYTGQVADVLYDFFW